MSARKKAIVHNKPGVTRDRKYSDAKLGPMEFTVVDTPGLEESEEGKNDATNNDIDCRSRSSMSRY